MPSRLIWSAGLIGGFAIAVALLAAPAASRADMIFAANFGNNTIEKYTTAGVASVFTSTNLNGPVGMAFDSSGYLYVANFSGNTIEKFSSLGLVGVVATASNGVSGPRGMAFDSLGNLYVANNTNNTVEKYTGGGGTGTAFISSGLNGPACLAFDTSGNLYVADQSSNKVYKYNSSGTTLLKTVSAGLSQPWGLAFDGSGNLYVSNYTGNSIEMFTPTGVDNNVGTVFATANVPAVGTLNQPAALAFDTAGNLYVANHASSTIERYLPGNGTSGMAVFANNTTLSNPFFVAVETGTIPVPEPATLSLLAVGGLVVLGRRVVRRRRLR